LWIVHCLSIICALLNFFMTITWISFKFSNLDTCSPHLSCFFEGPLLGVMQLYHTYSLMKW
jgi:hypothetical protein